MTWGMRVFGFERRRDDAECGLLRHLAPPVPRSRRSMATWRPAMALSSPRHAVFTNETTTGERGRELGWFHGKPQVALQGVGQPHRHTRR